MPAQPTSQTYQYCVLDVFTVNPLEGNPLAVFPRATGLDDAIMQRIARELNLSETVFVFPPENSGSAARLRIFTPTREMPFAGHPTVGTAFVLVDEGMVPAGSQHLVVEENVGPIPVRIERGDHPMFWLMTPPIEFGPVLDRDVCAAALGLTPADLLDTPPQYLSAGNSAILVALRDEQAVDRAWLDAGGMAKLDTHKPGPCVFVFACTAAGAYSRMFAPEHGVAEDPATGSVTGPLAAYMMRHNLVHSDRFVSEQGAKMGRRSLLHVTINGPGGAKGIEVGGHVTPLVRAEMRF